MVLLTMRTERGVCGGKDIVGNAEGNDIHVWKVRVDFDLTYCRLDLSRIRQ